MPKAKQQILRQEAFACPLVKINHLAMWFGTGCAELISRCFIRVALFWTCIRSFLLRHFLRLLFTIADFRFIVLLIEEVFSLPCLRLRSLTFFFYTGITHTISTAIHGSLGQSLLDTFSYPVASVASDMLVSFSVRTTRRTTFPRTLGL